MEKFGEQELRAPTKGQRWLPSSGGSVVCASLGITLGVLFVVFWEGQCFYWFLKGWRDSKIRPFPPVIFLSSSPGSFIPQVLFPFPSPFSPRPLVSRTSFGEDDLGASHFDCCAN